MTEQSADALDTVDLPPVLIGAVEEVLPAVLRYLPDGRRIARWRDLVVGLADRSPRVAEAFVAVTPEVLARVGDDGLEDWVALGRPLAGGGWTSAGLAQLYFTLSPVLLDLVSLATLAHLVESAGRLVERSPEIATTCLRDAPATLADLRQPDREPFLLWLEVVTGVSWAETDRLLELTPALLAPIAPDVRTDLLALARAATEQVGPGGFELFRAAAEALAEVDVDQAGLFAEARRIGVSSPTVAMEYLKSAPSVIRRLTPDQARQWSEAGLDMLEAGVGEERAASWFRLESAQAEEMLVGLADRVELVEVGGLLRLYTQALSGEPLVVQPRGVLAERHIGWGQEATSTSDGVSIFLPSVVETFADHEANFWAYKVHATHQAARLEFGSFRFELGIDGTYLPATTERRRLAVEHGSSPGTHTIPPMSRYYELFEDRVLITELFAVAEGARIDAGTSVEYPGISPWLRRLQDHEAERRPDVDMMPRRQGFVENLVRASLGRADLIRWPDDEGAEMSAALETLSIVQRKHATVQDTAEVAAALYDLAITLRNLPPPAPSTARAVSGEEAPFAAPPQPEFRGDFKPELVQLLAALRESPAQVGSDESLTRDQLADLLESSAEITIGEEGTDRQSLEAIADNLIETAGQWSDDDEGNSRRSEEDVRSVDLDDIEWFRYDEWDFRAHDYRPERCRLGERLAGEGDLDGYDDTLRRHHGLVLETRRRFEQMRPEAFRRVKRLEDGPEIDLDEAIQFHADKLGGAGPLARFYSRRNKIVRDVAVALLLDMSASTSEEIGRSAKRIIDIEKESTVLMIEALEAIGDRYGIYGFSGEGSENVEFHIVKELDEPLSDAVRRRVEGIEPLRATRMGAAIRHALFKLDEIRAKVKILILVSDGRPQDEDYGTDSGEKEYAVHDTKRALVEAKRRRIEPFLITVDSEGHDYLGQMCGDIGYEIVADIESLPRRLTRLYRYVAAE